MVTPSGDVAIAHNGKVRVGDDGAACCPQLYVQARRCVDGELVDLWFQYDCSLVLGNVACVISTNLGPEPLPFFFKLSGGDGTPYYVPGDDPKCTHGTIAGDVVRIASCGQCFDCSDSRPTSFEVSTSGVQIYNKFVQPFSPSIFGDTSDEYEYARLITFPLDELPSTLCICQSNLGDCLWLHRITDATTVTFRHVKKKISTGIVTDLSDEDVAAALGEPGFPSTGTASYDLLFVISKRGLSGEPHWFDLEVYLVPGDPTLLSDPLIGELTDANFILFTGRVVAEECEGEFSFSNRFTDYGPFPTDVSPVFPPAYGFNDSILESLYCTQSTPPCVATWCSDNTPICIPGSFLGYAFIGNTSIAGRSGDFVITSSAEYCTFEPTATVTIVGSSPNCNSNGFKGAVSTDGLWGGVSDPDYPDGLPLRTPNRIPAVDTILEYNDAGTCLDLKSPQDTTLDPHSTLTVDVDQGGTEITVKLSTALDGIEPSCWFGRKTLDDTDLTFCGYPNGVVIPFGGGTDPSEYNDLPYTGGYAVVMFRGTP